MKKLAYIFLMIFATATAMAQNWPEDPEQRATVEKNAVLLTDNVNAEDWNGAVAAFEKIYKIQPDFMKSLYQNGSKAYEGLIKATKDKVEAAKLQDRALELYDLRIKYFGEEAKVLNYKGLKAYNYLINRRTENKRLYDLYTKIYELNGTETFSTNIYALMKMTIKQYQAEELEKTAVLDRYVELSELMDNRIAEDNKKSDQQYKALMDQAFTKDVEITCEDIESIIAPKFKADKSNIKAAKQLVGLKGSKECKKDELYYEAIEVILDKEPSCGAAMASAKRSKKDGDYEWSIKFFNKALELCGEEMHSEINYALAEIYSSKGQKETARTYCQKAFGGKFGAAAHNLLGEIYFRSAKDCDPQQVVLFRSRYIAAYEEFKKGGDQAGMAKSKAQFPSNDDLFTDNKNVGDTFNTGCWMNVDVVLQKR